MVFVLYLAGLAVLIVVLALGLEFIQRRGAPTPIASAATRQEPVAAPSTAGTAGAVAAPPLVAGPPLVATRLPGARSGAVRDIILIVAVGLLALIALGSDWVFYHQLEEMRAARRALLAPQSARSERSPVIGRPFDISLTSQNGGAEPAPDIFTAPAPFP